MYKYKSTVFILTSDRASQLISQYLQSELWSISFLAQTYSIKDHRHIFIGFVISRKKYLIWLSEFPSVGNHHSLNWAGPKKKTFYN